MSIVVSILAVILAFAAAPLLVLAFFALEVAFNKLWDAIEDWADR